MDSLDPIDSILMRLKLEEKVSLLAAKDWWRTSTINRDGVFIPQIKVKCPIP
jgi:beta-glucosidase